MQNVSGAGTEHRQPHLEDADLAHAVSLSLRVSFCFTFIFPSQAPHFSHFTRTG